MRDVFKSSKLKIWLGLLAFVFVVCFLGPLFSPYTALDTNILNAFEPPSLKHILGTDSAGRDIFTRLLQGGQVSLLIGLLVATVEIIIGATLGVLAGYKGGFLDKVVTAIIDVFMCIPILPTIMVAGTILFDIKADPTTRIIIMALIIAFMGWPYTARLVRSQVFSIKKEDYMLACEGLGLPTRKRLFHIIPNIVPQISVSATISAATAIITESSLSVLGLGVVTPYPSWGNMLQSVSDKMVLFERPWVWVPSGICITATVMLIYAIGNSFNVKES